MPLKQALEKALPSFAYRALLRGWRAAFPVAWWPVYQATVAALRPLNEVLVRSRRSALHPDSVLHISYPIHTAHATVQILRRQGMKADYLAVGDNPHWHEMDFRAPVSRWPHVQAWREFRMLWTVVAKYEVVHCHFMHTMSRSGWELAWLKRMGRKVVAHYRGCELRDPDLNMRLHPEVNICQECDYNRESCMGEFARRARALGAAHADVVLVTTPDMKDFAPRAIHVPFFAPEHGHPEPLARHPERSEGSAVGRPFRIVHATNHPGIEGTPAIQRAIDSLRAKGHDIEFVFLRATTQKQILEALANADLAIGKMKMGYYANFQIEAMSLGVPTVTWVRPELMTPELEQSGLILCHIKDLERTLEYYITHPDALAAKRRIARQSILGLHDNERIASQLVQLYRKARGTSDAESRESEDKQLPAPAHA